jgi:transcription initiation factor TFIID subunit 2
MDLGTMYTKLEQGQYVTMEDFKKDMELIFRNCRKFNRPEDYPTLCASIVEKAFKKEWPKAMERKLTWQEKRGLQGIVSALLKEPV